jgi:formamidopyrimidine-DNA glycosylase
MPELPEIESLSRQLAKHVVGDAIVDATTRQPRALNLPADEFAHRVAGKISAVGRVGKSMTLQVPEGSLWLHLGMNGQALLSKIGDAPQDAVIRLDLASGQAVTLQRMFMGHAHFHPHDEAERLIAGFGVDPFSDRFTVDFLTDLFARKKKQAIKTVLMDQKLIAGIGNSYADEVLFAAGIHPMQLAGQLTRDDTARLRESARDVLERAASLGGDNEYTDLFGVQGRSSTAIHSQQTCAKCDGTVEQIRSGGRTSYVCLTCQPLR